MIRFKPDDWVDVLMRPFDMVSPEANIYVEIPAPDVRFAVVVLLAAALFCFSLMGKRPPQEPRRAARLLVVTLLATGAWLATSGNGRYFIPILVILGPLTVGLIRCLSVSRGFQLSLVAMIMGLQAFLLVQSPPWNTWAWLRWGTAPYFHVDGVPQESSVTYVTVTNISYSLIAPLFPSGARWVNLTVIGQREAAALEHLVSSSETVRLVLPTLPSQTDTSGQPSAGVRQAVDQMLHSHGLSLGKSCGLLPSRSIAAILKRELPEGGGDAPPVGFWVCPLERTDDRPPVSDHPPGANLEDVFSAVEKLCPRFFPPKTSATTRVEGAFARMYSDSDTKLYVLDDGRVMYKFWRSLNPVFVGTVDEVRGSAARIDCSQIRAPNWRSGGP
ncbi:hypothetical protein [Ramlibacter rhizophilus]|uniref:Uncharacterized protein n=1 Tax=Ramlibacter rhizophilus TaxID=1781167 RepID=A0A4Z0BHN2_9BURK|nr:hypothetical protein [Ramlibacter rhizophilus]TFY97899.1 hypothetical protein EZ242_15695 [Ramlibacter rhizophilus]